MCDRFIIPDKLYGRETEAETLLQAFERVANPPEAPLAKGGNKGVEMMLVAGFSGIGKTAVVNEVHKPIVRQRGYFIKGKFDQFQRNIPFSAFVQAFRNLMGQLLTESDPQIQHWKNQILETVGDNGQVIIEVIPELEKIIGEQPPAVELSGTAAQNRFNLLFQNFTQVFTSADHPLVMFLDDLQWADSASLKLMQLLVNDTGHLFIIGAYRDNEVNPAHPLMLTLSEIEKTLFTINTITLAPLDRVTVNQLVAETLKCPESSAWSLSQLIYQKTQGNPFFATQFLKALHQDGLIQFNFELGCWQCDLAQVTTQAATDDVVTFMALQLQKLPSSTQQVLQLAACIGNSFDLTTLAIVSEKSEVETAACLWKALQEGLILPQSEVYKFYVGEVNQAVSQERSQVVGYKFLHDRVQQAAYSLIPESHKKAVHLQIGQLLLRNTSPEVLEVKIFDIVNQLNQGIGIITQQSAKDEIAQINLMAGRKAKAATAYKAAVKYLTSGLELLLENSWETHYSLTFGLYRERAECEYLTGNLTEAEKLFDFALNRTQNKFDLADIYAIQMYLKMTQGENLQAGCEAGLQGLRIMGMPLPLTVEEQQEAIKTELEKLKTQLAIVRPADLFNLPEMTDPVKKICMSLLVDLWAVTYMAGRQYLAILSPILMLNLSLKYGNAESSGFAYCLYGMNLANEGDYQTAYEFGLLALKLDRHFNSTKFIYKTNNIFAHTINPYNQHLKTNLPISQKAYQISQEAGDVVFGVWAVSFLIWAMLIKGDRLSDVYAETEKYLSYVQQVNDVNMLYAFTLQRQFLLSLQDLIQDTDLLDERNNDTLYINVWRQKQNFEHGINWYCFLKLQLSYFYGRYTDAVMAAEEAQKTLPANAGFFPIIQYHFYYPLSLAALYQSATLEEKKQYWDTIQQHYQIIQRWAHFCPANFQHRYLLLSAEMANISGQYMPAMEYYDRAIELAKENGYIQEEALANELAAKFYLNWGRKRIAAEYITEAYYGYARWDAKAKVADLEKRYPQLLAPILQQTRSPLSTDETIFALGTVTSISSATSSTRVSDTLDLKAILKASQAISSEIELEKLLSSLLRIVIENAGADKCVLMLLRDNSLRDTKGERLFVKGSITLGTEPNVLQRLPVEDSQDIPHKLIYQVKHNPQTVVLLDATADGSLANDPYIMRQQPKSILCSPILYQGKLIGILYLENNLTKGAFTSDRVELLNLICTQAAISLENAQLYQRSQEYAQELKRSLNDFKFAQSRFHNLVDNVPGVVYQFVMTTDGSVSMPYMSSDCYELYQISAEEAIANVQLLLDMTHPEDAESHRQSIADSVQTLTPWRWEGRIVTPSGIIKWIHGEARIEKLADGTLVWDGLLLDISDRKQAELDLQQAQLQIIQGEKMSALGNLVAGVAHEINNPVGFLGGNIQPALDYINDLFGLIDIVQEKHPQLHPEVQEEIEAIDLEYIREDLPKLVGSMREGVKRIADISTSLRTFSRADTNHPVACNIHDGIDSTIMILKHRLKANENRPEIKVVKEYGNLPQIECYAGQLNQVFMNLLSNAIDAVEDSNQGCKFAEIANEITVKTELSEDKKQAIIRIKDNGSGMSAQVQSKIFDHLFTTKEVGKGTGLGLAIARQIVVEKHQGTIEVESTIGCGTEFCIRLPVSPYTDD
nr:AAA family ATPase [Kamptonema formosum]